MRVMVAFDGSAGAVAARDLVAHLRWPAGTAITLVAALERGRDLFGAPDWAVIPRDAAESEALVLSDLQETLSQAAEPLRTPDRIVETRVVRGRPATALLDEATALMPNLIVIGSRGHGPMATVLLGSVSTEVADHAPCPVLVARGPSVHRMIVAVDGSDSAQRAVATLSTWPIFAGLAARVVAVAEPPVAWATSMGAAFYPAWGVMSESTLGDRRDQLADLAVRACERLGSAGLAATTELREGSPADQLIRAADVDGADLIVLGSRGLSTLPRLLLGSVARSVLLHAPVSVLIIRDAKERVMTDEPVRAPTAAAAR